MSVDWKGVYAAVTTEFREDESLDIDATRRHFEWLIEHGIHGLVVLGTVGEGTSLDFAEKREVLRAGIEAARGRVPVVTGVAEYTTRGACRFAVEAEQLGADGLMVLPGMVYKAKPHENIHHFRTVARASGLPIMVYNNPVSYGVDLVPEQIAELADEPTIVAVKESSDDPRRVTDLYNLTRDRFVLLGGVDDLALESILLGAQGWVSGLVNAFPEENRRLWDLAMAGRWAEARDLYRWYTPLLHLDTLTTLVQCIKLANAEVGCGSEQVRSPRRPLAGAERERVLGIIRTALATRPAPPSGVGADGR